LILQFQEPFRERVTFTRSGQLARLYWTGGEELMAAQLRRSWELKRLWPAGEYTLLIDSHTAEDRVAYSKGDTLALSQWEATRLGNEGAIASPSSMYAVRARTENGRGTMRDAYLYRMWELAGAWEEPGRP
jgi:hypothetical protein